uniref:Putative phosphatase SPBPB21E7.02c n=1 Tax=Rhizophora mucronata TaxID=61149 RepID=A0A2P2MJG6_RHIMU
MLCCSYLPLHCVSLVHASPGEEFCSGAMETNLDLDQFPYLQQGEMSWRKRKRSKRKEKDERNGIKEFLTVITTNWIRI